MIGVTTYVELISVVPGDVDTYVLQRDLFDPFAYDGLRVRDVLANKQLLDGYSTFIMRSGDLVPIPLDVLIVECGLNRSTIVAVSNDVVPDKQAILLRINRSGILANRVI